MEPLRTTTIGLGESEITERPFHIFTRRQQEGIQGSRGVVRTMKAVERISAKLSSCDAAWRGFARLENMVPQVLAGADGGVGKRSRIVMSEPVGVWS